MLPINIYLSVYFFSPNYTTIPLCARLPLQHIMPLECFLTEVLVIVVKDPEPKDCNSFLRTNYHLFRALQSPPYALAARLLVQDYIYLRAPLGCGIRARKSHPRVVR